MLDINKIYNMDCIAGMKELEDNSIDAIVTDPPYNVSRKNNFKTMGSACRQGMDFGEWDKEFNLSNYVPLFTPILKQNANVVIFNSWENLGFIKDICEKNNIYIKRCLVLSKSNPAPFNKDRMFVNDVEFALWGVYNKSGKPKKWTFNRKNPVEKCVIPTTVQSSKLHPTMKDIKVIKNLVGLLTNENDLVLDPFIGSGTTAIACKELNRKFIGFEKEAEYKEIADARIQNRSL
jgi:site-specific DNA-methyltransferase (adenine-specific)